jgi:uncharacterized protein YdeI (YjbR/CyaY-like superfamily)
MSARRFTVELQRTGKTATAFEVPFDVHDAFGRARQPVKVTIRGHTYRSTTAVYGGRYDYVTWIGEAKRPDTRRRRIEKALAMLGDGRPLR